MNVPGGGKNDIPNRLKRQFAIFNVPQPSTDTLNNIFGALVQVRPANSPTAVLLAADPVSMHAESSVMWQPSAASCLQPADCTSACMAWASALERRLMLQL